MGDTFSSTWPLKMAVGEDSVFATLERLLIPCVADAYRLKPTLEGVTGAPAVPTLPATRCVLARGAGGWAPFDRAEIPDARMLALALPWRGAWLILERQPPRAPFHASDADMLNAVLDLAGQAWERDQLTERLLQARTAADAAAHRWSTVSRLSARLARSLELDKTLDDLLGGLVPYLADWAVVDIEDSRGGMRRATSHSREELKAVVAGLHSFPFAARPTLDAFRALPPDGEVRDGREWPGGVDVSADERMRLERLAPGSLVVLPLQLGGTVAGALTLVAAESGQVYDAADLVVFRDIARHADLALTSATVYAEARRARLEREEVLAIVSHDLRNPLNVVRFATSLLVQPDLSEERKQRQIPIIDSAVSQMNELIGNLLDASRIDAGHFSVNTTSCDPAALVAESLNQVRPLAVESRVRLENRVPAGLPPIEADRERLLRVFGNLLGNAIAFSSAEDTVTVSAAAAGGMLRFTVRDAGTGIDAELLEHIFDRYWQARRQGRAGAGLGLTIVRGIVMAHGGTVEVESRPGAGTAFHFTIPFAASANSTAGPA